MATDTSEILKKIIRKYHEKFIALQALVKKKQEKNPVNQNLPLKELEKEEQTKREVSRIKIREDINRN